MSTAFISEKYLLTNLLDNREFKTLYIYKVFKNKSETFKTIALAQNLIPRHPFFVSQYQDLIVGECTYKSNKPSVQNEKPAISPISL